jgi:chromosome segregation ATPase
MKIKTIALVATLALFPMVSYAQTSSVSQETIEELSMQVVSLQTQLTATLGVLDTSRAEIENLTYIIENSEQIAQQITEDLGVIISALEGGSENQQTMQNVLVQLDAKYQEYKDDDSEVLREVVAPRLVEQMEEIRVLDARRDQIVADAIEAQSMLRMNVREIEGLILVNATEELITVYGSMLDSAEGTVNDAQVLGSEMTSVVGIDSQ